MTKELICIGCPLGCIVTVTKENDEIMVRGNTCKRGEIYAKKEITNPTRMVTTTVRVENGRIPMVSVKTNGEVPKEQIMQCIKELSQITVKAPVFLGDIIKENVLGSGIDVIATKEVLQK